MSWIELRLAGEGNGQTLFRLDHIALVDDRRWAQFGPGAVGVGWEGGLIGLYLHLTTRQATDPAKAAEWSASDRTSAFYTGAPGPDDDARRSRLWRREGGEKPLPGRRVTAIPAARQ